MNVHFCACTNVFYFTDIYTLNELRDRIVFWEAHREVLQH